MTRFHKDAPEGDRHALFDRSFADTTARDNHAYVDPEDLGKEYRTGTTPASFQYWRLEQITPSLVFKEFAAGGGGGGEANTVANIGSGSAVYKEKVGVEFRLRRVNSGSGITVTENADDITIAATGGGSGDVVGPVSSTDNALARFDQATGKLLQNGVIVESDTGDLDNVRSVDLDILTGGGKPAHAEGRVFYDGDEHALGLYNDEASVTHQLGQEGYVRVYNATGVAIPNGTPVRVTGFEGVENRPTVEPAQANSPAGARVVGITTHTIAATSFGYVTYWGLANDLDTIGFSPGDPLYLSPTTPGGYVVGAPSQGSYEVFLGFVVRNHASEGRILVMIQPHLIEGVGEAGVLTIPVVKGSGGAIAKGQVVYISGYDAVTANRPTVELAQANVSSTMPAIGLALETVTATTVGRVVVYGEVAELNTAAFNEGDVVYVSAVSAGALVNTRPQGSALIQAMGKVVRSDASNGEVLVVGAGRTNALPNLPQGNVWLGDANGLPQETSRSNLDDTAIHTNASGEINGLTLKAVPASADIVAAEDSTAAFAKRKITVGSITPRSDASPTLVNAGSSSPGVSGDVSRADHAHQVSAGVPVAIGTAAAEGVEADLARSDHVHPHGDLPGGLLHAAATTSVNGFLSSTDKTKLDAFSGAGEYIRRDGTIPFTGAQSVGDQDLTNIKTATFQDEHDNLTQNGAHTIDWNNGLKQVITLDGDATLSFTAPPGPCNLVLRVVQDSLGGHSITWPASPSVKWRQGNSPNLSVPGDSEDLITFYYSGTSYYGGSITNFQ